MVGRPFSGRIYFQDQGKATQICCQCQKGANSRLEPVLQDAFFVFDPDTLANLMRLFPLHGKFAFREATKTNRPVAESLGNTLPN